MEDRNKAIDFLNEGAEAGLPMKAIADLLGVCGRTLRRWRMDISGQGFSLDRRKGAPRQVAHKLTAEERQKVIDTINDPRFADLPPWPDCGDPGRGTAVRWIRDDDLSNYARRRTTKSSRQSQSTTQAQARSSAGGNWHKSSTGLGYHPGARPRQGTTLLPLYGAGCVEQAHLRSGGP